MASWHAAASAASLANEYLVDRWDTENGLPQNSVTAVAQRNDGYLWVGTFDGLARFDGVSFKVFHPDSSDFPISSVVMLAVDAHDRLWAGSDEGKILCLTEEGFIDPASWGLPRGRLEFAGESPDGHVLIHLKDRGSLHSLVGDRFVEAKPSSPPTESAFDSLRSDQRWGAWERRGTNWCCLDSYRSLTNLAKWPADLEKGLQWIGPGRNDSVWFIANRAMRRLHEGHWEKQITLSEVIEDLTGMVEDDRGDFWFGTWQNGLFRASANGELKRLSLTGSTKPEAIRAVFKDREGNLWIGTDGSGLFRIKPRVFQIVGPEDGLASSVIRTVSSSPDGKIWILYHGGGLDRIDALYSRAEHLLPKLDLPWCGLMARSGTYWVGGFGGSVLGYDGRGFRKVEASPGDQTGAVKCLFEDDHGVIWVGNARSLRTIEFDRISVLTNLPPLQSVNVRGMSQDSLGNLYVGLAGGGLLRRNGDAWTNFSTRDGLPADSVGAVCADQENVVWIGCEKKGLVYLKDGRFRSVPTAKNALPAYTTAIFDDGAGHLWLGSAQGIYRINRKAALSAAGKSNVVVHVDHYGRADGLTASECSGSQPSICKSPDGRLWFATFNGVAVVDPAKVPANIYQPPVTIEHIDYDGHGLGLTAADKGIVTNVTPPLLRRANRLPQIGLPAGVARLEIHYTALSFVTPENVRFRYKLDGLDDHWVDAGNRRSANFTRLAPGPYRFNVIACNNDGVWNETGASLAIHVAPYYWQTLWFRCLMLLSLAGAALVFYNRRISELKRRQIVQQEFSRRLIESQEQERKRIAGELHDSLGHDLLIIKNGLQLGLDQPEFPPGAKGTFGELSGIASHAISGVRELARNLRPHLLDELGLTKAIQDTIRKVARASSIQFELEIDNVDGCLRPEFEINLFRIVQEALNNIVKHSKATEGRVELARGQSALRLSVRDNGTGFDQKQITIGGGFGLSGLAERVRIMGGQCEINSQPGAGTALRIEVPFSFSPRGTKEHA